jgi:hypothetical protein
MLCTTPEPRCRVLQRRGGPVRMMSDSTACRGIGAGTKCHFASALALSGPARDDAAVLGILVWLCCSGDDGHATCAAKVRSLASCLDSMSREWHSATALPRNPENLGQKGLPQRAEPAHPSIYPRHGNIRRSLPIPPQTAVIRDHRRRRFHRCHADWRGKSTSTTHGRCANFSPGAGSIAAFTKKVCSSGTK